MKDSMPDLTCANPACRKPFSARKGTRFCSRACQLAGHNLRRRQPATSNVTRRTDNRRETVLVIPDTQVKPGVPNDHLLWLHRWALHRYAGKPLTVVHIGDHYDMPSLSSYDKGKGRMEGRRYVEDLAAGDRGFELLTDGVGDTPSWNDQPWDKRYLLGNHENRIGRAVENDIQLEGLLSTDACGYEGWQQHDFLEIVKLFGVSFSHYFYAPGTGRAYGGENLETRLKTVGAPFVQGHQQGLKVANRNVLGVLHRAVVAGSFYQHDEEYLGPQANDHWRGVVVLNNVRPATGEFSLMEVELDYLSMKYAGHPIAEHVGQEL